MHFLKDISTLGWPSMPCHSSSFCCMISHCFSCMGALFLAFCDNNDRHSCLFNPFPSYLSLLTCLLLLRVEHCAGWHWDSLCLHHPMNITYLPLPFASCSCLCPSHSLSLPSTSVFSCYLSCSYSLRQWSVNSLDGRRTEKVHAGRVDRQAFCDACHCTTAWAFAFSSSWRRDTCLTLLCLLPFALFPRSHDRLSLPDGTDMSSPGFQTDDVEPVTSPGLFFSPAACLQLYHQ